MPGIIDSTRYFAAGARRPASMIGMDASVGT